MKKGIFHRNMYSIFYNKEFSTECSMQMAIKYINIFHINIYWNSHAEQNNFYNWDEKNLFQFGKFIMNLFQSTAVIVTSSDGK